MLGVSILVFIPIIVLITIFGAANQSKDSSVNIHEFSEKLNNSIVSVSGSSSDISARMEQAK